MNKVYCYCYVRWPQSVQLGNTTTTGIFERMLSRSRKLWWQNEDRFCNFILLSLFQPTAQAHCAKREATNARHHGVSNGNQDPTCTQRHGASASWVSFLVCWVFMFQVCMMWENTFVCVDNVSGHARAYAYVCVCVCCVSVCVCVYFVCLKCVCVCVHVHRRVCVHVWTRLCFLLDYTSSLSSLPSYNNLML